MAKEKNIKKINLIFDLDNTLISARKVYRALESSFAKAGIKRKDFQEMYRESKVEGVLNLKRFISLAERKFSFSKKEINNILKEIFKEGKEYLYPDVFSFFRKWFSRVDIFLVSLGDKEFQKEKLKGTGIYKFFKKILITRDERKIKEIQSLFHKGKKNFVIEDDPETLFYLKRKFKKIITIRINRNEGKYKDLPNNKNIDFSIKSLKELDQILEESLSKPRALLLFSGGLDSVLAAKILLGQGIKVKGITFKSYFFDEKKAIEMAKKINLPLRVIDISRSHLKIVKNPKYGYGKSMNPCLDCRILMLKKAKETMKREKFSFVATGEVLGERPMTQNKEALMLTEKESRLRGYLLRPLSARLLPKTIPERLYLVNRKKLLDIRGRSRKKQIELAKKYKIKNYLTPSGGCLLTDPEFSKRLKKLLERYPNFQGNDVELLKIGRHFWKGRAKIIVGRNESENKRIKKLAKKGDALIEMKNYPGPLTLIRNYRKGRINKTVIKEAKKLTQYYSLKSRGKKNVIFKILSK